MTAPEPELIIVGRLRKPHGVKGEIIVEPLTDAPAECYSAGRRLLVGDTDGDPAPDGAALTIESVREVHGGLLYVAFEEIDDRTAAELWRNRYLLVPADEVPPPSEDEVWIHELAGMHVSDEVAGDIGEVIQVFELPQGLVLDVRYGSRVVVLPWREEHVVSLDRESRRIVMRLPEGLLE